MSSRATRPRAPRHLASLTVVLAAAAALAGCSSGGTKPAAGGPSSRDAARAQAVCVREMPERSLIDLTDLTPRTESQLAAAMQGVGRAVPQLRAMDGNPVAQALAGDLAKAHTLGTSYLRLAQGDQLGVAADRFQELKRWLAQVQSDAALRHAPSCAVHALLD